MTRPAPQPEQLAAYADAFNRSQILRFYGITMGFPTPDRVRAELPVQDHHRGGLGTRAVNGAIISSLFDLVIGSTAALIDPTRRSATVQLSISFERPTVGDLIRAESQIDRAGKNLIFASAEMFDGEGRVSARCQGIVSFGNGTWDSGVSPAIF